MGDGGQQLQRKLRPRHITMIAIGGSIGTGIFVASGSAIYTGGPGGALLAFAVIGLMVYFLMTSLGEMSALIPVTGTFCDYSGRFIDPAFGFAMSYNYWFNWAITVAVDLSAASVVMKYWFPNVPIIDWSFLFFLLIFAFNLLAVGLYGEVEYWFSVIKVTAIIVFLIVGIALISGLLTGHRIGLTNWTIGDAPFHRGWFGFINVLLVAGFSFQGTETFGVAAGEAQNPRESIPRAVKTIFWRISLFYILTMVVISFVIPYTDKVLMNSHSDVMLSPFTIIFKQAGLSSAATVINMVVLTAILSSCNASMYTATRTLWSIAKRGQAPKIFARTTSRGLPLAALIVTSLVGSVAFLSTIFGSSTVFVWLMNISGLSGFIAWLGIAMSHYRFRKGYIAQGNQLDSLPYVARFFPFSVLFSFILCVLIILGQQPNLLDHLHFNWGSFIGAYIGIPLFLLLYLGYKFINKTKLVRYQDIDFNYRD